MHEALAYLPQILPAYLAYLVAVVSPGPAIMAIVSTSMTQGRRAGMTISLGIFGGSLTWATAAALGLATLLQAYAMALEILKVLGGLYLLYLAIKNAGMRWRRGIEWTSAMGQFAIQFGQRFPGSAR